MLLNHCAVAQIVVKQTIRAIQGANDVVHVEQQVGGGGGSCRLRVPFHPKSATAFLQATAYGA